MKSVITRLKAFLTPFKARTDQKSFGKHDMHVVVPDAVRLPLPRAPREEMSVPASINGRDLSTGRL
ncbi:hypothetical protein [Rhizobium oryzicola]|uniref:Uncharacterized protein n=1 Tax=Rhizobium oryzicola TaxID=1232668 RepID=A0ABT8T2W4_9HYPH|nr:hypothetical protein [Rhizobium oryzicola]MDO1584242.1 hypothetical protein [Rhizobium oryzicola]